MAEEEVPLPVAVADGDSKESPLEVLQAKVNVYI